MRIQRDAEDKNVIGTMTATLSEALHIDDANIPSPDSPHLLPSLFNHQYFLPSFHAYLCPRRLHTDGPGVAQDDRVAISIAFVVLPSGYCPGPPVDSLNQFL